MDYGGQLDTALGKSLVNAGLRIEETVYGSVLSPIGRAMARAGEGSGGVLVDNIIRGVDKRIELYMNNNARRPN